MPRISVIIPTYNRASLLCETLDSVFAQTCRDYEITVVDDGSTDDTQARLESLPRRINYRRIEHAGQGAARNAGLSLARAEYITFLDSDDLWQAEFLDQLTAALDRQPEAGFAYCDYATFDEHGVRDSVNLADKDKISGSLFSALLESDFLCTGALLFRGECFQRVGGFDTSLPPVEDWDMWLRIAHDYTAVYIDQPLLRVRVNRTHASRNPQVVYSLNLRVLAKLRRAFPQEAQRYRSILSRQTSNFHRALARSFASQRQPFPALKHAALMTVSRFL